MLKFSIITPVYNREDSIARCIKSVIHQKKVKGVEWEHLVVDDGSTDSTASIVEQYAQRFPNIRLIRFGENRGTNAARNEAVRVAQGEFCILLDSDDYFCEQALLTVDATVCANPKYNEYAFACDDLQEYYRALPMLQNGEGIFSFKDFLLGKVTGDFVHVIKTSIMKAFPFDEEIRIYEGVFFLRFYKEAQKILFVNEVITMRERGRSDSVTLTGIEISKAALLKAKKAANLRVLWFKEDYERFGAKREWCLLLIKRVRYCIMLGEYEEADIICQELKSRSFSLPIYLRFLRVTRLGQLYQSIFSYLLRKKYHIGR